MTETVIQRNIMKYLQLRGFKVYKISDRFRAGIPDLYAVRGGQSYWFEVKAPGGRVSKIQEYEIRQLTEAGAAAYVVRSVDDVRAVLKGMAEHIQPGHSCWRPRRRKEDK